MPYQNGYLTKEKLDNKPRMLVKVRCPIKMVIHCMFMQPWRNSPEHHRLGNCLGIGKEAKNYSLLGN